MTVRRGDRDTHGRGPQVRRDLVALDLEASRHEGRGGARGCGPGERTGCGKRGPASVTFRPSLIVRTASDFTLDGATTFAASEVARDLRAEGTKELTRSHGDYGSNVSRRGERPPWPEGGGCGSGPVRSGRPRLVRPTGHRRGHALLGVEQAHAAAELACVAGSDRGAVGAWDAGVIPAGVPVEVAGLRSLSAARPQEAEFALRRRLTSARSECDVPGPSQQLLGQPASDPEPRLTAALARCSGAKIVPEPALGVLALHEGLENLSGTPLDCDPSAELPSFPIWWLPVGDEWTDLRELDIDIALLTAGVAIDSAVQFLDVLENASAAARAYYWASFPHEDATLEKYFGAYDDERFLEVREVLHR